MNKMTMFLLLGILVFPICSATKAISALSTTSTFRTYKNPVIDTSLPDPSIIKAHDGYFYLYATEDIHNLPIYKSKDLIHWSFVGTAFTNETRPSFVEKGNLWAPDINYINGQYVLYYSMSRWGEEWKCGIGVATSNNPEGPFIDHGKLFLSSEIGVQNSIDEFFVRDHGHNYLFWGSFHGIYCIELSADGLTIKSGARKKQIAGSFMEGSCILKKNGYYYLIGSNGTCCEGLKSTYQLTVGRSKHLLGPYITRQGKSLLQNHFTVLLHKNNQFVGTGHNSEIIVDSEGQDWLLYHAFMKDDPDAGRVILLDQLKWCNNWPYIENDSPSLKHKIPLFKHN